MVKNFKYFSLAVKALIPISFFALANIDRVTDLSQTGMNAIAGFMFIITLFMYGVDYLLSDKAGKDAKMLQVENEALTKQIANLKKKVK